MSRTCCTGLRGWLYLLHGGLILALIAAAVLMFRAWGTAPEWEQYHRLNSDTMFPFHVARDVVIEGNAPSGWKFPISPFLFPDIALSVMVLPWHDSPPAAMFVYSLLQFGLAGIGFFWLARLLQLGAVGSITVMLTLLIMMMLECRHLAPITPSDPPTFQIRILTQLFRPQTHAGLFVLLPFAWALAMLAMRSNRWLMPLFGLSALLMLSDPLTLVQWFAPLGWVMMLAITGRWLRWQRGIGIILTVFAGVLIGHLLGKWCIERTALETQAGLTIERIERAWAGFTTGFFEPLDQRNFAYCLGFGFTLLVGIIGTFVMVWRWRGRDVCAEPRWFLTLSFFGTSGVLSIAALILGGHEELRPGGTGFATLERFYYPYLIAPLFLMPMLAASWVRGWRWLTLLLLIATLCALGDGYRRIITKLPADSPSIRDYQPMWLSELDAVLAERGCTTGLAEFWDARVLTLLSQRGFRAFPITGDLRPFHHLSNRAWWESAAPALDFIIVPNLADAPARLRQAFGEPSEILRIGDRTIWFYPASNRRFREEFFARAGWLRIGEQVTFTAHDFEATAQHRIGPGWSLARGRYRLHLEYQGTLVRWAIGRFGGNAARLWASGEAEPNSQTIATEFSIDDSTRILTSALLETTRDGRLIIQSLRLERLE